MWLHRTHVLALLNELTGDKKFKWEQVHEDTFNEMKALLAHDCLNAYPDLNAPFEIYTDASDYRLGAAIIQNNWPVAYYSRSLSTAKRNYTTTEKELLAIVLCIKEY